MDSTALLIDLINETNALSLNASHVRFFNPMSVTQTIDGVTTNSTIVASFDGIATRERTKTLRYNRLDIGTAFETIPERIATDPERTHWRDVMSMLGTFKSMPLTIDDFVDGALPNNAPAMLRANPLSKVFIGEKSFFIGAPAPRRIRLIHRGGEVTL